MFNYIMFALFSALIIPKDTRANALVFFFAFFLYEFIPEYKDILNLILAKITDQKTTFYYLLSSIIDYVIIRSLVINHKCVEYIILISVVSIFVNLIGWMMYESYLPSIIYDSAATSLTIAQLILLFWSWRNGRVFIKNSIYRLVCNTTPESLHYLFNKKEKSGMER